MKRRPDILVVAAVYPTRREPARGAFVADLVQAWRDVGLHVPVIAPTNWSRLLKFTDYKIHHIDDSDIVRPMYCSITARIPPLILSTYRWSNMGFDRAVMRAARPMACPRAVYGHFFFPAGAAARLLGRRWNVPSVCGLGESNFEVQLRHYGETRLQKIASEIDGFVCVSKENQQFALEKLSVPNEKILLAPNAPNLKLFRPHDRTVARQSLGLPRDAFLVAFTGAFIDRKGPLRVLAAIRQIPNAYGLFFGTGPQVPRGDRVLHCGVVPHDQLALWLSAADVFVLPTKAEGYCNAVNEALACGLPVVGSDIAALDDQLGGDRGLRVPAENVEALSHALRRLATDASLRETMSNAARQWARQRSLLQRSELIAQWIENLAEKRGAVVSK